MRDVNENTILIATNNPGKAREYAELFGAYGLEVKTLKDFTEIPAIVEDGKTFTENARKKAQTLSDALGVAALADDSGLVVDALNGEPGIYSARYAKKFPLSKEHITFGIYFFLVTSGRDNINLSTF